MVKVLQTRIWCTSHTSHHTIGQVSGVRFYFDPLNSSFLNHCKFKLLSPIPWSSWNTFFRHRFTSKSLLLVGFYKCWVYDFCKMKKRQTCQQKMAQKQKLLYEIGQFLCRSKPSRPTKPKTSQDQVVFSFWWKSAQCTLVCGRGVKAGGVWPILKLG